MKKTLVIIAGVDVAGAMITMLVDVGNWVLTRVGTNVLVAAGTDVLVAGKNGVSVGFGGFGVAVTVGVIGVESSADPSLCNASRYAPYPDELLHSVADSTAVPSPHSLKEVTSWKNAFEATMLRILEFQRVRSRDNRSFSP